MKIIKQSSHMVDLGAACGRSLLKKIEMAGRTCYKSESKITDTSASDFVEMILRRGHESVLEHHNITMRFITDRGVTHEIVRHRIASYSQESTRYCNYAGKDMEFIVPVEFYFDLVSYGNAKPSIQQQYSSWERCMAQSEARYNEMIHDGASPQLARSVLPNSLKTEIVMTANLREWRHFFKLRCAKSAHPQMRELAWMALNQMYMAVPVVFADLWEEFKCF